LIDPAAKARRLGRCIPPPSRCLLSRLAEGGPVETAR
jgi:hypothetical protein